MTALSFKDFVLAKGFTLPVSALAVAKSLNMNPPPPASMRAMIATAAPFVPIDLAFNTAGQAVAWFYWLDQAAPPSLFGPPPQPEPLRAATSFEFKLWSLPSPTSQVLVNDVILPLSSVLLENGGMAHAVGVLSGNYLFQITAINHFGSAASPQVAAQFAPPASAPNITVSPIGKDIFQVQGTGFDAWNGRSISVNAAAGLTGTFAMEQPVSVSQGAFTTRVNTAAICGKAGPGASVFFTVVVTGSVGGISNIVTVPC